MSPRNARFPLSPLVTTRDSRARRADFSEAPSGGRKSHTRASRATRITVGFIMLTGQGYGVLARVTHSPPFHVKVFWTRLFRRLPGNRRIIVGSAATSDFRTYGIRTGFREQCLLPIDVSSQGRTSRGNPFLLRDPAISHALQAATWRLSPPTSPARSPSKRRRSFGP